MKRYFMIKNDYILFTNSRCKSNKYDENHITEHRDSDLPAYYDWTIIGESFKWFQRIFYMKNGMRHRIGAPAIVFDRAEPNGYYLYDIEQTLS